MCARPKKGSRWCSHRLCTRMSRTTTSPPHGSGGGSGVLCGFAAGSRTAKSAAPDASESVTSYPDVIARSAFGDIYLLGGARGRKLHIIAPDATMMPPGRMQPDGDRGVRAFFRSRRHAACDLTDADGNDLFARALARLGPLRHDEMYGFVPALAFGGPATLDRLQKVNAVEHLLLLAGLEPLQVLPSLSF